MVSGGKNAAGWRARFAARAAALGDPKILTMLALGFSSGLPYMLVFSTTSAWLTEVGVDLATIGLFSFAGIALSIKFIWAPLIDHVSPPILGKWLGRHRAWILLMQLLIIVGILIMSSIDPAKNLSGMVFAVTMIAFALATQDTAIDAWRIQAAGNPDRQAALAAPMLLGARIALLISGAGALFIADVASWPAAYAIMAALMGVGVIGTLCAARQADPTASGPAKAGRSSILKDIYEATVIAFLDFFRRHGPMSLLILAVIGSYRLPDFLTGVMANPFYLSLGFTKTEIAFVAKVVGVSAMLAGTVAGGFLAVRIGVMRMLVVGALLVSSTNIAYFWLAGLGHNIYAMAVATSLENFAGGLGGTALIAYMSSLTSRSFTATQFALLSSFISLPGKIVAGFSGFMVEAMGGFGPFFHLHGRPGHTQHPIGALAGAPLGRGGDASRYRQHRGGLSPGRARSGESGCQPLQPGPEHGL